MDAITQRRLENDLILHSEIQRVLNDLNPRVILSPRSVPFFDVAEIIRAEVENLQEIQTGETDEAFNSEQSMATKSTQNSCSSYNLSDNDENELADEY